MNLANAPIGHDLPPYGTSDFNFGPTSQLPMMNMAGYGQPAPFDMLTYQAPVYGSYDSSAPLSRTKSDATTYSTSSGFSNQPLFGGYPGAGTSVDLDGLDMSMNPLSSDGNFDYDTNYTFNMDHYDL